MTANELEYSPPQKEAIEGLSERSGCDQFDGDAVRIAKLKRGMTVLKHNPGVVDADLGEMLSPDKQRAPVRHGERQMIQNLVGQLFGRTGAPCKHHHNLCRSVFQRNVPNIGVFRQGTKAQYSSIPPGTCCDIRHKELHVRQTGDWCAISGLCGRRHPIHNSQKSR
jgi:hypothetical protein